MTNQKFVGVVDASICTDCYMFNHYGDDSFSDHVTPDMNRDIKREFDKLGNVSLDDHHGDYCTRVIDGGDCNCSETHFSWAPCDICRSPLGGDRHDVDIRSN